MVVGTGQGSGLTNRAIAATGGEETHALTGAESVGHTHTMANHTHPIGVIAGNITPGGGAGQWAANTGTPSTNTSDGATFSGTGAGHNTMPPFLVSTYIIKT